LAGWLRVFEISKPASRSNQERISYGSIGGAHYNAAPAEMPKRLGRSLATETEHLDVHRYRS
jgi:hypothetical protein